MEARSPLAAVQAAVYDRLTEDDDLMAMVTAVGDDLAEAQDRPYIQLGEFLSTPDNAHGSFGRNVVGTLHTWTGTYSGRPGQLITDRVEQLLDHQKLPLEGHRLVSCRFEFGQVLRDPDPAIRHHVQRFRFLTEQQPE